MHHYRLHQDPRSSHQQIMRLVRELGRSPVLDVGAAQGMLGQQLQNSGIEIDGVEPNSTWADSARPHYRQVFNSPVECSALPPNVYRVIVCADVLEHVTDPAVTLAKLLAAAKDDSVFIISLPNVAHIAVRAMLFVGLFPRMERGILDKTHLHFFTRRTAIQMLDEAGLRVERTSATPVPLDELWRGGEQNPIFKLLMAMQHLMVRLLPRLFGYQWIFVARPRPQTKND